MRLSRASITLLALAFMLPAPVAAQSPEPSGPPVFGPAVLEALCTANATNEADLELCLDVVHRLLYPGSGPVPTTAPSGYGGDLPGVGATQSRDSLDVTLVEVDWDAKGMFPADGGNRYVAIRVLYLGTEDGGSVSSLHWTAVDLDGFEQENVFIGGKEPDLGSSNDLPAGRKAQGWVTFEVPKSVHALEIVESYILAENLRWLIREPGR